MARIGMRSPVYRTVDVTTEADGTEKETYGAKKSMGKAISADATIRMAEAKLYADDGLAEMERDFVEGTLTIGTDDLEEEAEEELLGATVEEDGTVINNADDESPYVQVGYIAARQKGGKKQYRGVVYTRVQFSVPNETANTKGETITFTTPVLTGTLTRDKNGDWRRKSKWSELEEANTWLDSFMTKNA